MCRQSLSIKLPTNACDRKTFVLERKNNSIFCPLDHLLSLEIHGRAFELTEFTSNIRKVFYCEVLSHKSSLASRWRNGPDRI